MSGGMTGTPGTYALGQNYPNPFNPTTTLDYDVPVTSEVMVVLFDVVGRPIRVLLDETVNAGRHKLAIDGSNLSSGTYFLRMVTKEGVFQRTITLRITSYNVCYTKLLRTLVALGVTI